jgi:hypothetical protein
MRTQWPFEKFEKSMAIPGIIPDLQAAGPIGSTHDIKSYLFGYPAALVIQVAALELIPPIAASTGDCQLSNSNSRCKT